MDNLGYGAWATVAIAGALLWVAYHGFIPSLAAEMEATSLGVVFCGVAAPVALVSAMVLWRLRSDYNQLKLQRERNRSDEISRPRLQVIELLLQHFGPELAPNAKVKLRFSNITIWRSQPLAGSTFEHERKQITWLRLILPLADGCSLSVMISEQLKAKRKRKRKRIRQRLGRTTFVTLGWFPAAHMRPKSAPTGVRLSNLAISGLGKPTVHTLQGGLSLRYQLNPDRGFGGENYLKAVDGKGHLRFVRMLRNTIIASHRAFRGTQICA